MTVVVSMFVLCVSCVCLHVSTCVRVCLCEMRVRPCASVWVLVCVVVRLGGCQRVGVRVLVCVVVCRCVYVYVGVCLCRRV